MPEDPNEPAPLPPSEDLAKAPEATPVERLIAREIETDPEAPVFTINPPRRKPGTSLVLAGVVLPSIAILIEGATRICAETFFDPLPTIWHTILVIVTPLANGYVIRELRRDDAEYHWRIGVVNGLAVVVSAFYTAIYLPIMPLALFTIVLVGLGLLPLSPVLSLITSAVCLRRLRLLVKERSEVYGSGKKPLRGFGYGMALATLALIAAEAPALVTRVWLAKAASDSQTERTRAINLLRRYGSEKALLNACHSRGDIVSLIGVFLDFRYPVDADQARTIFYRVTGKPYDSARSHGLTAFAFDDRSPEIDETGELRGLRRPELSLASSRI
ncbi:MAG: hypothetical protein ACREAM_13980, partial [Blastocatellia bacterium]